MIQWTVKISVDDTWVADGFEVTEERLKEAILEHSLGYAYDHEIKVVVLKSPPKHIIDDLQNLGPYDDRGSE
jgi:hypothetical protein